MPGPGGGSRGGGFSGGGGGFGGGFSGGGRGGGFGGGGFHGGPHRRPPRHHFGFFGPRFYFGPRYYYGGGGCLGGLMGFLVLPIIFILISTFVLFSTLGDAITAFREGGIVVYDEEKLQTYALERYDDEFASCEGGSYEDNILVVFLVDEECKEFSCIGIVGYHIDARVDRMFGDERTELGRAVTGSVSDYYKNSLSRSLANVALELKDDVTALGLTSNHTCTDTRGQVASHLTNLSELSIDASLVDGALEDFTAATGIPLVIVVDEREAAFGRNMPLDYVIVLLVALVFLVVGIVLIVKAVKESKKHGRGGKNGGNDDFSDFGGGGNGGSGSSENKKSYDGGRTDFH